MIKCTEQYNIKCLVCKAIPHRLIMIGAYYMCPDCFNEEFGEGTEKIDPKSKLGDIYYKWLKVYREV